MNRAPLILFIGLGLAALLSLGVYAMKFEVERQEARLAELQQTLQHEEETIQVLQAEWSYLNRPDRLRDLATRYLKLAPVAAKQLQSINDIPLRDTLVIADGRAPLPRLLPTPQPTAQAAPGFKREAP